MSKARIAAEAAKCAAIDMMRSGFITEAELHEWAHYNQVIAEGELSLEHLAEWGYKCHHRSLMRGYVSRKEPNFYRYSGRFGEGWRVESNNPNSNRYSYVEYWVK